VPDILCCWGGRFLALEVKAPGRIGSVTELQKYQISGIIASGGIAAVVDSVESVEELLCRPQ
jgi:hypothetical protein